MSPTRPRLLALMPFGQGTSRALEAVLFVAWLTLCQAGYGQTTVYWDTNGNSSGAGGTAPSGTWDQSTTSDWSKSSSGGSTGTWSSKAGTNGIATFSAGTGATGNFTVSVSGNVTGVGGITFQEGNVTISGGSLTLSQNATISTGTGAEAISSVIKGTGLGINKTGTGSLTLSGANTFTGGTTLTAGTLTLGNTAALGAAGAAVTLASGTLALNTDSSVNAYNTTVTGNVTLQSGKATASSAGITQTLGTLSIGTSTLSVTSGSNVAANSAYGLTFGTTSLTGNSTFDVANNGSGDGTLTLGTVSGTGSVTKSGAGTLTYSGANTYTGGTTLSAGAIIVNSGAQLAGASSALTVNSGTLTLNNAAQTVSSLNGTGGTIALGSGHAFTVNDTTSDSYAGSFSGGSTTSVNKSGSGTLTLSGASSAFTGSVNVTQGTLAVANSSALGSGTAGTTVSSGAALDLTGGISAANGNLSLAGTGVGGSGALYNGSGNNTWNGSIVLSGNATIAAAAGTLTLGGTSPSFTPSGHNQPTEAGYVTIGGRTLTFTGSGTIQVNDRIRDFAGQTAGTSYTNATTLNYAPETTNPGNVVVDMSSGGLVHFYANANSYTGTTYIKNGTLLVDTISNGVAPHDGTTDSFHGINGAIEIGNGSSSATLMLGSPGNEVLSLTSTIKLYQDGTFNVNGQTQTIDALTFSGGGTVQLGTGSLFLNNDVTVNATAGQTALITSTNGNGYLSMTLHRATGVDTGPDATRTFTVSHGAGNTSDLTINAIVQAGNLVKAGTGTMTLTDNNTYTGFTNVNAGILNVQRGTDVNGHSALGSSDGTDAQGTTVANGATLQVQGGIAITTEKLNLNGSGYSGAGALESVSGINTWGAAGTSRINLQSDSRINTDAGSLSVVTNIISSANNALTVGGAGNTTISGGVNTGTGSSTTVTKDGSGTLTLSGANSYQGATYITQGVLSAQNNYALGAITTGTDGTFVSSGAQLQLDSTANGNLSIGAESLTLNGTGISNSGALLNAAGNNTFGGLVTLGSSALIAANTGTSLTLSGGTASANFGLTVGTGANAGDVTISGAMSNGSGSLTKNGAGTLKLAGTTGTTTDSVGAVSLATGNLTVGNGTQVTTVNATSLSAAAGTSLLIASGSSLNVTGNIVLSGTITSSSAGTLQINGGNSLTFNNTVSAPNLTLVLNGGSVGTNASPVTVYLGSLGSSGSVTVGSIHITGDTVLDFGNSAGTFLSSTNLVIDPNVKVSVVNWVSVANSASQSTIWYLRNLSSTPAPSLNSTTTLGSTDIVGGSPLNQISFTGYSGTTTWVSGSHDGWFDHEIRPTPEPGTYGALLISGCLGFIGWRRVRRSKPSRRAGR